MSHTVLRGEPYASQLYLDSIIDEIRKRGHHEGQRMRERDEVNLGEIIYHVMKRNLNGTYMIDGSTGETVTNESLLEASVSLARALVAKGMRGKHVLFVVNNHRQMAALYYACLFVGVHPMYIEPNSTKLELSRFVSLLRPQIIFCERARRDAVVATAPHVTVVLVDDDRQMIDFRDQHSDDLDDFQVAEATPHSTALLLPTSGTSGFPKATVLCNGGLVAQLATIWLHHDRFPSPTRLALLLSTAQWMTCTVILTSCPVFGVPILMTSKKGPEHVLSIIEKYRPTWGIFGPSFMKDISELATGEQLASLETIISTGAPMTANTRALLESKVSKNVHIANGIGITEAHGFYALPARGVSPLCNGNIFNTFVYKIVDEQGNELNPNQRGELCMKSDLCVFKSYLDNEEAYSECVMSDGWFNTGDVFYENEDREVFFIERKKFWFKYMNYQIAPEELEQVIGTVGGVQECAVCGVETGPAALVVTRASDTGLRERIHDAVKSTLSDYKRLRGGIAFVDELPRTPNGKLKRTECVALLQQLIESGNCV
ncbi:luciferin 4-monooxygenase [Aphomia sociella]